MKTNSRYCYATDNFITRLKIYDQAVTVFYFLSEFSPWTEQLVDLRKPRSMIVTN